MLYISFICIAYILGILWGLNLNILSLAPIFLFIIICMLFKIITNYYNNNLITNNITKYFNYKIILAFLISILLGLTNTYYKESTFKNKYNEGLIEDIGEIIEIKSKADYYNKYLIKLKNGDKMLFYYHGDEDIKLNSIINFKGKYKAPLGIRNKGGYDYSRYLYSQNIYGSIYSIGNIEIIERKFNLISIIRDSIINTYKSMLPQKEFSILLGMIIGDTDYIDEDIENSFKVAGITHLLAVSRYKYYICFFSYNIYI